MLEQTISETENAQVKADIWRKDDVMPKVDYVNHPPHYKKGGIECIEAIRASMGVEEFAGYLKGNVIKYVWRYREKGHPVEDLKKAHWYLDRLVEHVEAHPNHPWELGIGIFSSTGDWHDLPYWIQNKDLDGDHGANPSTTAELPKVEAGKHSGPNAVYLGKPGEGHDPSPDDLDK